MTASNIRWHEKLVGDEERAEALGQRGVVLWLTGLSGSGKSTIAMALEQKLLALGRFATVLDGDNVRHDLCRDLGFTLPEREENLRRVGAVARLFCDAGCITIASFISPTVEIRERLRDQIGGEHFFEVYVSTPLSVCEGRDVKGLYARARAGELSDFTGVSAPYEAPPAPVLTLDTTRLDVDECCVALLALLKNKRFLA